MLKKHAYSNKKKVKKQNSGDGIMVSGYKCIYSLNEFPFVAFRSIHGLLIVCVSIPEM